MIFMVFHCPKQDIDKSYLKIIMNVNTKSAHLKLNVTFFSVTVI